MSILFLILKIIGILILIPIVLLLILLIFPICYQIEGDFDGKSPKAQVKVSWAVIFLRAKAFYEEELLESGFLEYRFMIQGKNTGLYLESIKRKIGKNIRKDQTLKRNKKIKKTIRNE